MFLGLLPCTIVVWVTLYEGPCKIIAWFIEPVVVGDEYVKDTLGFVGVDLTITGAGGAMISLEGLSILWSIDN